MVGIFEYPFKFVNRQQCVCDGPVEALLPAGSDLVSLL